IQMAMLQRGILNMLYSASTASVLRKVYTKCRHKEIQYNGGAVRVLPRVCVCRVLSMLGGFHLGMPITSHSPETCS
ncbi:UDP-N-acetylmuramoyl-L-alanyl-D-glutamate--2,6-diaminopimelate ligase, partial [Clarias magur]